REAPMDFTALRYFSETAHSCSIRAASERLHVSASAISRQIAKLEHELRAPVFDRRAKGMTLTPAGLLLLGEVDGIVRRIHAREVPYRSATGYPGRHGRRLLFSDGD